MATATAKKAPAKTVAKQAPPPAVDPIEDEGMEIVEGSEVRFLGYAEDTPEEERLLTEGEIYTVVGFVEAEGDDPGGGPIVQAPNPNFNAKKKEHPETNPKFLDVEVLDTEIELADPDEGDEGDGGEDTEEEQEEEEEAAPPPAAKKAAKGKAKVEVKEKAKPAAKKTAAKGKTETKAAPEKSSGKTKPAAKKAVPAKTSEKAKAEEPEEEEDPEAVPDLENEDAEVLALVEGSENLIETAQDLDDKLAQNEYTIGGLLYHIKKDKLHHNIVGEDNEPLYAGKGGWASFLVDHFKMEYRKAQHLLEIYVHFTLAGIENPAEVVSRIGYTKAKTIAKKLTEDEANVDDLIELAETNSMADLSTAIKESEHVGGTKGEKKTKLTVRFRYYESDAKTVDEILKAAAEAYNLKDIGEALLQILVEWQTEFGGATDKETAPAQRAVNGKAPAKKTAAKRASVAA